MKYVWENLPKKKTVFTVRNATLRNLNTGEIIQHYSSNTRIDIVQKCVTEKATYYRTQSAEHNNLNWAFEASAFGLPNELAPLAPCFASPSKKKLSKPVHNTPKEKQTSHKNKAAVSPKNGVDKRHLGWIKRLFGIKK